LPNKSVGRIAQLRRLYHDDNFYRYSCGWRLLVFGGWRVNGNNHWSSTRRFSLHVRFAHRRTNYLISNNADKNTNWDFAKYNAAVLIAKIALFYSLLFGSYPNTNLKLEQIHICITQCQTTTTALLLIIAVRH
jgi:hypothetical protein